MKSYSLDKINELSGGDHDFAKDIMAAFLEEIPQDLDWLAKGFSERSVTEIYQASHKIKPNLDLVGADKAYQLVSELNRKAKNGDGLDGIQELYEESLPLIQKLLKELEEDFS